MALPRLDLVCSLPVLAGAAWLALVTPSLAQDCTLKPVSSVALEPSESRLLEFVPVQLNGVDKKFVLDTGGYETSLTAEAVAALKLPTSGALGGMKFIGGTSNTLSSATVADFRMGTMRAKNISMLVRSIPNLPADGLLAADLFLAYDLDMDFGHDKLNFISSDHCPGKVVYWKADAIAEVPMRITEGHYLIKVTLDGRPLTAMVDTGATYSSMGMKEAQHYFGLGADSPDMVKAAKTNGSVTTYRHKFSALSFDGVAIQTPTIAVLESNLLDPDRAAYGAHFFGSTQQADMILGMDILRHLHVYIATKERKLYITPA